MFSTNQSSAFILDQQQSAVYRSRSLLLAESHCFLHLCENGQISIYWFRFQRFLLFCLMEFCFLHVYWWNWASQRWQPADNTTATVTMVFVLATLSDCTEMWRRVLFFCFTVDNATFSSQRATAHACLIWVIRSYVFTAACSSNFGVFSICCTSSWGELSSWKAKSPNILTATWPA